MVNQKARCYMFWMIAGTMMADTFGNSLKLMYLPMLEDVSAIGSYSWGSATLACLYRFLCKASQSNQNEITGFLSLLQAFNVLQYEIGQGYHSHYDAFDPSQYGPQKSQRVASFLLYLSDVEEGGETMFPFESGQNMDSNYDFCKCIGLKVKPRRGDGLLFYSLFPNGTIDLIISGG